MLQKEVINSLAEDIFTKAVDDSLYADYYPDLCLFIHGSESKVNTRSFYSAIAKKCQKVFESFALDTNRRPDNNLVNLLVEENLKFNSGREEEVRKVQKKIDEVVVSYESAVKSLFTLQNTDRWTQGASSLFMAKFKSAGLEQKQLTPLMNSY